MVLVKLMFPLLLASLGGLALAEKADKNKPMHVEADALRHDELAQTSVFTGRVVVTKGSIIIRGASMTLREDAQGYQHGLVTAEAGKLGFFRQKREALDEFIEGEGETIEYDGKADTVKFIKKAQLRRYRGATLNDEMNGNTIVYNNSTDFFTMDGLPAQGVSGASAGRVRAMLTPKPKEGEAASPDRPTGLPQLRVSPALAGPSK